jgi:hypothetical protein
MAKKHQLPKKVLGVKLPKPLRNLDWLTSFVESDVGRRILGERALRLSANRRIRLLRQGSDHNIWCRWKLGGGTPLAIFAIQNIQFGGVDDEHIVGVIPARMVA